MVNGGLPDAEQQELLQGLYECSACGQCHVVCPVRINTHELWEQARQSLAGAGIPQPEAQIKQLQTIKVSGNAFGKPQQDRGFWAKKAWETGLLKAPVPLWKDHPSSLLYFAGCTASFDPDMQSVAVQTARLLQEAGVDFSILGDEEPCCIGKLRRMGDLEFGAEARKRIELFEQKGIKNIVVSCAGCFKGLHSDYNAFWPGAQKVVHLTQLLDQLVQEGRLRPKREVPMTVTYHDPCHLGRHNQIYDPPRRILQSIPGLTLTEMPRHRAFSYCCGMGGGLKLVSPSIQHSMAGARIHEAESTGTEAVVTPCQTCYQGLMYGVEETSSAMKIFHLNEMLIRSICPEISFSNIKASLHPDQ